MSLGGAIFAALALILSPNLRFRNDQKTLWVFGSAAAWIAYSSLNLLVRPWDERTFHTLGNLPLLWVPVAGLLWTLRRERPNLAWPLTLTGVALLVSVGRAAWQFFALGTPASSFLNNPLYFAYNLLPACVFFGEIFAEKKDYVFFKPAWGGALSLLCVLGIFCSVSRMPLTCALIYVSLRAAPALQKRAGSKGLGLAALLLISLGVSAYRLSPAVHEKLTRTFSADDPSRDWRAVAWKHNWGLFTQHPLLGVGPEKNGILPESSPEFQGHWEPHHLYFAHDIYLQSLADSGLVGTLLWIGFWAAFTLAVPFSRPLLIVTAIGGLTENIFSNSKAAHAVFFYALLCALLNPSTRRSRGSA